MRSTQADSRGGVRAGTGGGHGSWGAASWASLRTHPSPEVPAPPIGAVGLLTVISKGCSAHCEEDSENYYVGKRNITCCSTDLCNASGAHALQPAAAGALALLTALGGLLLGGPHQL